MNLSERFDVSPGKVAEVLARLKRLGLNPAAITEEFLRGGGKGGQKINKTANCVRLTYPPLELTVRCQTDRRRTVNRFLALRELVDQAEIRLSPKPPSDSRVGGRAPPQGAESKAAAAAAPTAPS